MLDTILNVAMQIIAHMEGEENVWGEMEIDQ